MIEQLDTENADRDIKTAYIVCLTHTPSTVEAMHCQGVLFLGDGAKDLDGTGGAFKTRVTIGSQESVEKTHTLTAANTQAWIKTDKFLVKANTAVTIEVLSPNAADTDVDVTAYLYDMDPSAITNDDDVLTTLATTPRDRALQVWRRLFKDVQIDHTNLTLKTRKNNGTTIVTTQVIEEASTIERQYGAT
jgi:hypothetical protein